MKTERKQISLLILALSSFAMALMSAYRLGVDSGQTQGDSACAARQAELRTVVNEQVSKALKAAGRSQ